MVVEWLLRKVVVVGGGWYGLWVVVAVDGGGWEEEGLFVNVVYVLFSANAAYAAQYKDTTVAYMIYYVKSL